VEIKDFKLPVLDEPVPPSLGQYSKEHTKVWAATIDAFDDIGVSEVEKQAARAEEDA